jgi:hypothetical protein
MRSSPRQHSSGERLERGSFGRCYTAQPNDAGSSLVGITVLSVTPAHVGTLFVADIRQTAAPVT